MYAQNIIKRGVVFAGVSMAWPMFVAMSTFLLPEGLLARVERIGHIKSVYTTGFWCLIFIAPALVSLLKKLSLQMGLVYTRTVNFLLYTYACLITAICLNQIFYFPKLISRYGLDFAAKWYLSNSHGLLFVLNQLAYGILGLVFILLFIKPVKQLVAYPKKIAIISLASSVFFLIGALAGITQWIGGLMLTYVGMLLLIPFGFFSIAYGMAEYKESIVKKLIV